MCRGDRHTLTHFTQIHFKIFLKKPLKRVDVCQNIAASKGYIFSAYVITPNAEMAVSQSTPDYPYTSEMNAPRFRLQQIIRTRICMRGLYSCRCKSSVVIVFVFFFSLVCVYLYIRIAIFMSAWRQHIRCAPEWQVN